MGRLYLKDESELDLVRYTEKEVENTVGDDVKKAWWKIRIYVASVE